MTSLGFFHKYNKEQDTMLQKNKLTNRTVIDRRLPIDRRTLNLGPKYPNGETRKENERRQHWEKRSEWKPLSQWSSSPLQF
jgi:hypothetical protein